MESKTLMFRWAVVACVVASVALCAENATGRSRDLTRRSNRLLFRVRRYSHLLGVNLNLNTPRNSSGQGLVCAANQCLNRATCVLDENAAGGFKCRCERGFYGVLCNNGLTSFHRKLRSNYCIGNVCTVSCNSHWPVVSVEII